MAGTGSGSSRIVSGGQTGVDRAALDVALELGLSCGGWCPKGRAAEDGPIPGRYPLEEIDGGYVERTEANVVDSDGTVIIHSGPMTGGTRLTFELCRTHRRPCLGLDWAELDVETAAARLAEFVDKHGIAVLNVAGPRASGWPDGYGMTSKVLRTWLAAS